MEWKKETRQRKIILRQVWRIIETQQSDLKKIIENDKGHGR